jgi:integrase
LDIYTENERGYEFLKLYLIPEYTKADKETNTNTLQLANAIKAKKIVELQNNQHGFSNSGIKSKMKVSDYIIFLSEKRIKETGNNKGFPQMIGGLVRHLERYKGGSITFKQIDKKFVSGFIDYMKTATQISNSKKKDIQDSYSKKKLSQGTQTNYYNLLVTCLNQARKDGIISSNPANDIDNKPKRPKSTREYLTIDEVRLLANTECASDTVKQAFLFSCLCGLRISDIKNLTWGNLRIESDGNAQLRITQQKTDDELYLPLSNEAMKQLPDKGNTLSSDKIFVLPTDSYVNLIIRTWSKSAGITKHVSFHCSRHTFATLELTYGASLYTVSKLLGHTNIKTTEIYAKIIDETKRKAVDMIPCIN